MELDGLLAHTNLIVRLSPVSSKQPPSHQESAGREARRKGACGISRSHSPLYKANRPLHQCFLFPSVESDIMALALPRVRGSQRKSGSRFPASWGLSRRLGVRVLLHRDLLTCRFLDSMPRSFLRRCYRTDHSRFSAALRDPCSALTPINGSSRSSRCASGMTVPPKGHSAQPAASSNPTVSHNSSSW